MITILLTMLTCDIKYPFCNDALTKILVADQFSTAYRVCYFYYYLISFNIIRIIICHLTTSANNILT